MNSIPTNWKPIDISEIQSNLKDFKKWALAGGHSIDWFLNKNTREHADIDIGVFREDLFDCLTAIGRKRVYLCSPPGSHLLWDGGDIRNSVYDIWVTSESMEQWAFQIVVYDKNGSVVTYKRDNRIKWSTKNHILSIRGLNIINPQITILYKLNRQKLEDKDCLDISNLLNYPLYAGEPS
ncbi:MAG: hypothetical protein COA79_19180 [Planctomycetota bacterium]|nr:MAG: hypothetical protein COA79_19180 [Planctomycetota bacterium]